MSESKFIATLNLSPDQRLHPPKAISKLKSIEEWASSAIDAVKDNSDFLGAIKELSPWADAAFSAAKDSIGPLKFVVKLFEELTKIQDPEELARLAYTLAYQSAAEAAIEEVGHPVRASVSGVKLDDAVEDVDLSDFNLNQVTTHAFVSQADRILQHYLPQAGFSPEQVDRIVQSIHDQLPNRISDLLSNGKTKEKFDPLSRWLLLPPDGRLSRTALRRHAEYTSWVFNKAPVLQCEPYALADVCIEAECSRLTYGDLKGPPQSERPRPNPFAEGDANGGRHDLSKTVMEYIADPKSREPIVIQGSAGSGKSTFTLRLADHLRREGLRPIRIRLRDVVLGKEFYRQLGDAIAYEDDQYLRVRERFAPPLDPLQGGLVFQEELRYKASTAFCPYVLILDGWDEISVAVSEGLKLRVKELLLRIRSELLRPGRSTVRIILTGRPSDAVDECTEFFRDETPILTIRTLEPKQLPSYANKLRHATETRPLRFEGVADWTFPEDSILQPMFERYRQEFQGKQEGGQQPSQDDNRTGVGAVLGFPLLLHFTFRLLAERRLDPKQLIESPATLLRLLTDFATSGADLPSDRQQGAKIQARLSGTDLRGLLRRTAAHMTALGKEAISKAELERRLRTNDLAGQIKDVSKDNLISALLVSFYFKGGNTALGCEFTHKAFREYLYPEEIVEVLKGYARRLGDLPERPASLYWKEFDKADLRDNASREIATLLAPQWLSREVVSYLQSLLEWEAKRTFSSLEKVSHSQGETSAITHEQWVRLRTLTADLWDWWADGVPLRPQPRYDENTGQIHWDRSLMEQLVPGCRPFIADGLGSLPEPVRTVTLDAHLGDALSRVAAWAHWYPQEYAASANAVNSRYQRLSEGKLRFRPSGLAADYFTNLCHRISSAGWRPDGPFPAGIMARGIDFAEAELSLLNFTSADLESSSFHSAYFYLCGFHFASLAKCDLGGATINQSSFICAVLDDVILDSAQLWSNRFNGSSLLGVSISQVSLGGDTLWSIEPERTAVGLNDFSNVRGIDLSTFAEPVISSDTRNDARLPRPRRKAAKGS